MVNHIISLWVRKEALDDVLSNVLSNGTLIDRNGVQVGDYIDYYFVDGLLAKLLFVDCERKECVGIKLIIPIGDKDLMDIFGPVTGEVRWCQ